MSQPKLNSQGQETYHDDREADAKQNPINAKYPDIIVRLHDPRGKCDTHDDFLPAIRVPVVLVIFPDSLVGKPTTRLDRVKFNGLFPTIYKPW
jgi:hypothetical protein